MGVDHKYSARVNPLSFSGAYTGPILGSATVEPILIVYDDETATVRDEEAFQEIVETRRAQISGTRHAIGILSEALAANGNSHPVVTALAAFDQAIFANKSYQPNSEKFVLKGARDAVAKAPSNPYKISERDCLQVIRADLMKQLDVMGTSVEIRRID